MLTIEELKWKESLRVEGLNTWREWTCTVWLEGVGSGASRRQARVRPSCGKIDGMEEAVGSLEMTMWAARLCAIGSTVEF